MARSKKDKKAGVVQLEEPSPGGLPVGVTSMGGVNRSVCEDSTSSASSAIPEELSDIWDDEIGEAYAALEPRQRLFLVEYVKCRYVGRTAYRAAYNPLATDNTAGVSASRLLTNVNLQGILKKLQNTALEDMFLVRNTFKEAAETAFKPIYGKDDLGQPIRIEEIPDFAIRVKAAAELRELHAPALKSVPADGNSVTAQFTSQFNFYLQQLGAAPIQIPNMHPAVDVIPSKDFGTAFKTFAGA